MGKVGQSKEKGKTKQATLISDFHADGSRALFGLFVWRGVNIDDVTIHPSRGSWINPTLKVCEHNRVSHASEVIAVPHYNNHDGVIHVSVLKSLYFIKVQ